MALRKGMVLEIDGTEAVILTDRGEFQRIPIAKRNLQVGMEITLPSRRSHLVSVGKNWTGWLVGAAAAVLLMLNPFLSLQSASGEVVAYVDIDINPSIQLAINADQEVVAAEPFNNDGRRVLSEVRVVGDDMEEAAARITEQAVADGFINKNRANEVKIALSPAQGLAIDEKWESLLTASVNAVLLEQHQVAIVDTVKSSAELRLSAKKQGLSVGKFIGLLAAKENNLAVTVAELKKQPLNDVMLSKGVNPAGLKTPDHTANEWDRIAAKYEPELTDGTGVQVALQKPPVASTIGTGETGITPVTDLPKDPTGVVSIAGMVYGGNKTKKAPAIVKAVVPSDTPVTKPTDTTNSTKPVVEQPSTNTTGTDSTNVPDGTSAADINE